MKGKEFGEHFNALTARVAADDVAKLSRPQTTDAFELGLPADFKLPEGIKEFKIDAADPLWSQAREWALKHGLSNDAFKEGIALIAGDKIGNAQKVTAAFNSQIAALGPAGTARVSAVNTWLDAMGVGELKARMFTAGDVQKFETLITKFTNQGAPSFRVNGREPPTQQGRVSDAEFAKMGPAARLDYARQFPQDQFKSNGARQ